MEHFSVVKLYSKDDPESVLAIRDGKVILARTDPFDDSQKWYKDESNSSEYKDDEGYPCFSLINKATAQALKHSVLPTHCVQLTQYNVNVVDGSILWTQGIDLGDGFGAIRMLNNTHLSLQAFETDAIVLSEWFCEHNQIWKIEPDTSFVVDNQKQFVKLYLKADPTLLLSIRHAKLVLSRADPTDDLQKWYKVDDHKYNDDEGFPCFALVNKATAHALKHSVLPNHPVQLTPYDHSNEIDGSILWTKGIDLGDGFGAIRMLNNTHLNVGTNHSGIVNEGDTLVVSEWYSGDDQIWMIEHF